MRKKLIFILLFTTLLLIPIVNLTVSGLNSNFQGTTSMPQNFEMKTSAWQSQGNPVCTATGSQGSGYSSLDSCADGEGGAIIAWYDDRSAEDVYAQKVDGDGNPVWTSNGVLVDSTSYVSYVKVINDGAGGGIFVYNRWTGSNTFNIYAKRINATGNTVWGPVTVSAASDDQWHQVICSDGNGGAIIAPGPGGATW